MTNQIDTFAQPTQALDMDARAEGRPSFVMPVRPETPDMLAQAPSMTDQTSFEILTSGLLPISDVRSKLRMRVGLQSQAETKTLLRQLLGAERKNTSGAIRPGSTVGLLANLYLNAEPETGAKITKAVGEMVSAGDVSLKDLANPVAVGTMNGQAANAAVYKLVQDVGDPILLAGYESARAQVLFEDNPDFTSEYATFGSATGLPAARYDDLTGFEKLGVRTAFGRNEIDLIKEITTLEDPEARMDAVKDLIASNAGDALKQLVGAIFDDPGQFAKEFMKEAAIGATPVIGQIYELAELGKAGLQALSALQSIFGIVDGISKLSNATSTQDRETAIYGLVGATRVATEEIGGAALEVITTEAAVRGGRGVAKTLSKKLPKTAPNVRELRTEFKAAIWGWSKVDIPKSNGFDDYFAPKTAGEIKAEFRKRNDLEELKPGGGVTAQKWHETFSHLLQPGNELSFQALNLTDIVDAMLYAEFRGTPKDRIVSKAEDVFGDNRYGNGPVRIQDSTAEFISEQIDHNAALNGISRREFLRRLDSGDDTLLLQRPRYHPLEAKPQ